MVLIGKTTFDIDTNKLLFFFLLIHRYL